MKDYEFARVLAATAAYLGLGVSAFLLMGGVTIIGVQANTLLMQQMGSGQTAAVVTSFNRTLARGVTGNDVRALQQFFITKQLLSTDSATGYFGVLTEAAVRKFQSQQGIVSSGTPATTGWGVLGPKTRAVIAKVAALATGAQTPPSLPAVVTTQPTNNTAPAAPVTPSTPPVITVPIIAAPNCTLSNGATAVQLQAMLNSNCTTISTAANAQVTITSNGTTTIPASIVLAFNTGSRWTLGAGTIVLVQGSYQIPLQRTQFFDGAGQIKTADSYNSLGCPLVQRVVYPEWFGAKVNDGADDSGAILQALALGNKIDLAAGTYDVRNRIPLLGHQTIVGKGKSITRIDQMPNANLVNYGTVGSPYYQDFQNIKLQDFIVSLTSDCASISDLSVLGNRLPDDTSALSNYQATIKADPLVVGIQISSSYGWRPGVPPVKNLSIKNVEVYRPLSSCLSLQSDRGAQNVIVDGVTCTARTEGNTSGMTMEAYHPTYGNHYDTVTISNSTFNGGRWGLYIAGVRNLVVDHVTVNADPGSFAAVLYYTSDAGHQTTGVIRNSTFNFANPGANANSVIQVAARGYVKDREGVFPYLQDVGTTLSMDNDTITSAEYGATTLIPLIHDEIGLSKPLKITNSTFTGGSYAVLAANPKDANAFGATVWIQSAQPGGAQLGREPSESEITTYRLAHSDYDIENSTFNRQAMSAIRVTRDALTVTGNTFNNIGTSPQALDTAIIDVGGLSPYTAGAAPQNTITNNRYSGVKTSAFVKAPNVSGRLIFSGNTVFAFDTQSKSAATMDALKAYDCSSCGSVPASSAITPSVSSGISTPPNPITVACPSNLVSQGACTLTHLVEASTANGLAATFYSWVHPGLVYTINFGDGTEKQMPTCTTPLSGQPNSCTGKGYVVHTYASAGTYKVLVINYSCAAGSSSCNQIIDSMSATVH